MPLTEFCVLGSAIPANSQPVRRDNGSGISAARIACVQGNCECFFDATCATQTEQGMQINLLDEGAVNAAILRRSERLIDAFVLVLRNF